MLKLQLSELPESFKALEQLAIKDAEEFNVHVLDVWAAFWKHKVASHLPDDITAACEFFWTYYQATKNQAANFIDESGLSPLHTAAKQGYDIYLKTLSDNLPKDDLNPRTRIGATPLHLSAAFNHTESFMVLENAGADVNARMNDRSTCLHLAANCGNREIIANLLALPQFTQTALVTEQSGTALHVAVANGQTTCIELLMPKLKNIKDNAGNTPFHTCVMGNLMVMVEQLLPDYKDAINAGNNDNWTPLMIAVSQENISMTHLLLNNGALCNVKARNGQDALSTALKNYFANPTHTQTKLILDAVLTHAKEDMLDLNSYQWFLQHLSPASETLAGELRQLSAEFAQRR